jgi:SNF2 family DNA or RNA helicase
MGMGGGKTASTLTAIVDLLAARTIRAAIIIAPVRVALTTWPNEIAGWEHTAHLDAVVLSGTPERRLRLLKEKHEVYICSIDLLVWLIDALRKFPKDDPRWDMLVIDELSRFKSPRGERAKKLNRFTSRFGAILGLTGTPRPNGWEDQWMPIQIVSAGTAWPTSGFDEWRKTHFMQMDFHGYRWEPHHHMIPKMKAVIDEWTMTVPSDEATDVPFNYGADYDVVVPLTKAQERDLETLKRDLLVELGHPEADLLDPDETLVAAMSQATASGKMTQLCQGFLYQDGQTVQTYGNAKLDALDDLLAAADGENVVIVYHYRHDLEALRKHLKGAEVLGAETKDDDAVRIINAWNEGKVQYLLCHPASVGHGIQLQFGGRRMIWYAMTWSHEHWVQMCKRIARPGQKEPVYVHRLLADHWLERLRVQRVDQKMAEEAEFIASLRQIA